MLEVLRSAVLSSVQDLGRSGFRDLGIRQGGAMDRPALMLANRLVGNPADAAAVEISGEAEFRFEHAGWLALTGATYDAQLDGQAVWPGWRTPYQAGARLRLRGPHAGMWLYLAVAGGIAVPKVFGSRACDLEGHFGGHEGRALKAGDCLPLGKPEVELQARCGALLPEWNPILRAMPGPEHDSFEAASLNAFWRSPWQPTARSTRMASTLSGPELVRKQAGDLHSHALLPGVVQVPPAGQPFVPMAEAQTTGGYPRIACVIEADLWKLAQARPGTRLHFLKVGLEEAQAARRAWQAHLRRFEWSAYGR